MLFLNMLSQVSQLLVITSAVGLASNAWFPVCSAQTCDTNVGPAGAEVCAKFFLYNEKQFGTCLTDTFIRYQSKGRHECMDRTATFCVYQCMLETFNKAFGDVYSKCRCHNNSDMITPTPWPEGCPSPDGSDCSWYRNCLEKRYPCEETSAAYAITFAEKFCQLYEKSYEEFSINGREWINAVRKCLQVQLAEFLRSWENPDCEKISNKAFASHEPCYLNPFPGAPSYCDLSFRDRFQVLFTLKSAFLSVPGKMTKAGLTLLATCSLRSIKEIVSPVEKVVMYFKNSFLDKFSMLQPFRKRSTSSSSPDETRLNHFAAAVGKAVADKQGWEKNGVVWFAYPNATASGFISVSLILADQYTYEAPGFSNATRPEYPADINVTLWQLGNAVRDGTLHDLQVKKFNQSGFVTIPIEEMKGCSDWYCQNYIFNITATPPSTSSPSTSPSPTPSLASVVVLDTTWFWLQILMIVMGKLIASSPSVYALNI